MRKSLRVLFIEDSKADTALMAAELQRGGFAVTSERVDTGDAMRAALRDAEWDVIISDHRMPQFDSISALIVLQQMGREIPLIIVSGVMSQDLAVATMKAGAYDYLMKDDLPRLVPAVKRALREVEQQRALRTAQQSLQGDFFQTQKMEAIRRLAGGVAHDFNNILTAIIGFEDLVRQELPAQSRARRHLQEIGQAAQRAATLTRQLQAFSHSQVLAPQLLDLNALVRDAADLLRRLLGSGVELVLELAPDLKPIHADPTQIQQVIMNLADNARDAMPTGGKLTIATATGSFTETDSRRPQRLRPGDCVTLSIADTGTGMTREVKQHLFEPFFTTKAQGQGTGLGLAACSGIIEQSGGAISVDSEAGRGTTFTIFLPAASGLLAAPAHVTPPNGVRRHGATVLLAEDDPLVREVMVLALEEAGYQVWQAENGAAALALAQQRGPDKIDALVTDVMMPEMNGQVLAAKLRELNSRVAVLFCSGFADEPALQQNIQAFGGVFLAKPFTGATLAAKVTELLNRVPA